jgi:hypothetical protein
MMQRFRLYGWVALSLLIGACGKEAAQLSTDLLTDYQPLQVGRTYRYTLDSLKFINFGVKDTVVRYQILDRIQSVTVDGAGDSVYTVVRSIRDSAQTSESAWRPNGTFALTRQQNTLVEQDINNFRVQKLKMPVTPGMNWKGNRALVNNPYAGLYDFTIDADIQNWNFFYLSVNQPATVRSITYPEAITVEWVNDSSNVAQIPRFVASRRWMQEQYAKGVGLISRDVVFWEFQPIDDPNGGVPKTGYYDGFGVKMRLIEVR